METLNQVPYDIVKEVMDPDVRVWQTAIAALAIANQRISAEICYANFEFNRTNLTH